MGSLLSCDQCYARETNSVITFSDALVLRYTEGVEVEEEKEGSQDPTAVLGNLPDSDWFQRIHCIDDSHTLAYGLSFDAFNKLARRIERQLNDMDEVNEQCKSREVLECYKKNKDCGLNCQRTVETFVDCIDTIRLRALKRQMKKAAGGDHVDEDDD